MTMLEERVSSTDGAYDHLATKADVQELRGDMNTAVERLRGDLVGEIRARETRLIIWIAVMQTLYSLTVITAVAALLRLFV